MTLNEAYNELNLRCNATYEEIRTAYAHKCKDCSPESNPEKWFRLYTAYKLLTVSENDKTNTEISSFQRQNMEESQSVFSEFDDLFKSVDTKPLDTKEDDILSKSIKEDSKRILEDWVEHVCKLKKKDYLEAETLNEIFNSCEYKNLSGTSELVEILLPLYQVNPYRVRKNACECLQMHAVRLVRIPGISKRAKRILEYDSRVYLNNLMYKFEKKIKKKNKKKYIRDKLTSIAVYLIVLILTMIIPGIMLGCGQLPIVVMCYMASLIGGCTGVPMLCMHIKKREKPAKQAIILLLCAVLFACGFIYYWEW